MIVEPVVVSPEVASNNVNSRVGRLVTLTGYGATTDNKNNQQLRFATLQIHSQSWCNRKYRVGRINSLPDLFTSDVFCAGYIVSLKESDTVHHL